MAEGTAQVEALLRGEHAPLLELWVQEQLQASTLRSDLLSPDALRAESDRFLGAVVDSAASPRFS